MEQIQTYIYPQGQQLSDGELVQVQVKSGSRLVFKEAYFHELQEGDVYIIPTQVKLPPATDTEILDFLLHNEIGWTSMNGWVKIWSKDGYEDLVEKDFDPEVTDLLSVFRELLSEIIHNTEL
jgi:hypothetical protein